MPAVATGTYPVTAPYTPATFAAAMRLALIDAGWMTEWHATFTSGSVVNCVVKVDFDVTKTYGSTFLWFKFSGADMYYHICRGWNTSTNVPQGVSGVGQQYVDYLDTNTNGVAFHMRFAAQNASANITIKRYSSTVRPDFCLLFIKNGSTEYPIILDKTPPSSNFVDLDYECWEGFIYWPRARVVNGVGTINFQMFPVKLRGSCRGRALRGVTTATEYGASATAARPWEIAVGDGQLLQGSTYGWVGNTLNDTNNTNFSGIGSGIILMEQGYTNVNPTRPANYNVSFYDVIINPYTNARLPADFGIYYALNNITLETFTSITIQPGVEVGEVIAFANGTVLNEKGSPLFYARTL